MAWEWLREKEVTAAVIALAVVLASIFFVGYSVVTGQQASIPEWWSQAFLVIISFFFATSATTAAMRRVERLHRELLEELRRSRAA